MTLFGPLAFLSPWLLTALLALPVIWWLLRVTPPAPERRPFPPTRILVGIGIKEEDRAHSPWWLTAIRLAAAAAVILALARPVINPQLRTIAPADLYVLLIDNGWAAAGDWPARLATASQLVEQLEPSNRPLLLLTTTDAGEQANAAPAAASKVREQLASLVPYPWAPDRAALLPRLKQALAGSKRAEVYYLADGLDYGHDDSFMKGLEAVAGGAGHVTVITSRDATGPLALAVGSDAEIAARVISPGGITATGRLLAEDAKGRVLTEQSFKLEAAQATADVGLDLPLELRNQIARVEIEGLGSAGGVFLLDGEANRRRVGLVSGESAEEAQPLLSSLYYLRKALSPYAELTSSNDRNTASAVATLLQQSVTTLTLAGIGRLGGETAAQLEDWVGRGGILIRFAGPRLEQSDDDGLLPVRLRQGERALGGALSWSKPQPLAAFEEGSPFYGLAVPADVAVSRQVLADPASLGDGALIWARLADGTPLVTAKRLGRGLIVLFHVTANSDWSSLPHSGLFVDMLRRLTALSTGVAAAADSESAAVAGVAAAESGDRAGSPVLAPLRLLDGFGHTGMASPRAEPLRLGDLGQTRPSAAHPPGIYGAGDLTRALNIASMATRLTPLALPAGMRSEAISREATQPLAPYLLALALLLFLADGLIIALLKGLTETGGKPAGGSAGVRAALLLGALLAAPPMAGPARAETDTAANGERQLAQAHVRRASGQAGARAADSAAASASAERFALDMTLDTRLAFVRTGDPAIDRNSYLGLAALSRQLARRTAFEPGDPVGVDIGKDELAFFPLLYWAVPESVQELDDDTIARVNAYMKQGGLILFDTRDEIGGAIGTEAAGSESRIAQLIGRLDIPPLEPVANDHVLTRTFYLLDAFPGRWAGGQMWTEATEHNAEDEDKPQARSADGVSSILITSNDLAGAWAEDEAGSPLYAVAPGGEAQREMAYRAGINVVMYALTGNYKSDQVHLPALMRRLGQ
jgi:hypothetical protein